MAVGRLGISGVCHCHCHEIATDVDALNWTGKGQRADAGGGLLTIEGQEF